MFEYYYERKREAFHEIDKWGHIRAFYVGLKQARSDYLENKIDLDNAVASITTHLDNLLKYGMINGKVLEKYSREFSRDIDSVFKTAAR